MIVVTLKGGLGNQMFQYAAARAVALRRGDRVSLDLSWYERHEGATPRRFELDVLKIEAEIAETDMLARFARGRAPGHLRLEQEGRHLDPRLAVVSAAQLHLDGYWQSEGYFINQRARLSAELEVASPPDVTNGALLERLDREPAPVAVHVRRGDYVSDPRAAAHHGTCTLDYYRRGAAQLRERLEGATFYVFTDDEGWAREHLDLGGPFELVGHNGPDRGQEDLRLMRRCHSFLIANSSFSWWGAWLGERPDSIVVAPRRWFADQSDEGAIVPGRWSRL